MRYQRVWVTPLRGKMVCTFPRIVRDTPLRLQRLRDTPFRQNRVWLTPLRQKRVFSLPRILRDTYWRLQRVRDNPLRQQRMSTLPSVTRNPRLLEDSMIVL